MTYGPAAIAAYWTAAGWPSSRQLADRYIKVGVRGSRCPTDSLDAALAWRKTHTAPRSSGKKRATTTTTTRPEVKVGGAAATRQRPMPDAPTDSSLESSLARVRAMETEQYRLWLESIELGDASEQALALRAYNTAQKARLEAESLVVEHQKELGLLVSLPAAQELISQRLSPLRAARVTMPRELALELFPEAPHRAQPRIEAAFVAIFDPAAHAAAVSILPPEQDSDEQPSLTSAGL